MPSLKDINVEKMMRTNPELAAILNKGPVVYPTQPEVITTGGIVQPTPRRIRQETKPLLNKLESDWLEKLKAANPGVQFHPQSIRFKLANGSWYKPDMAGWICGHLVCYECKGPKQVKGCAKGLLAVKVAAAQFPEVDFRLVWKEHGDWQNQRVLA